MHVSAVGELAALGCALVWSTSAILFTTAGRMAPPLATNFFKTGLSTLIFALLLWIGSGTPWPRGLATGDLVFLLLSGLAGFTLADSCLMQGFQVTGTRVSNLLMSMAPILGALGGWWLLGETLEAAVWLGMGIAVAGVVLVLSDQGTTVPLRGRRLAWGLVLGVGAASGQAAGALLAKPTLLRVPTLEATLLRVAAGTAGLLLYAILRHDLRLWSHRLSRWPVLWRTAVASLIGTVAGVWLLMFALDRAPTGVVLTLVGSTPLWLLPLGWWLQRDRATGREVLGAVVAVVGIAILLLR